MLVRRKTRVESPPRACALSACMGILGGTWTPNIIWYLRAGPRRFSELKDDIEFISAKMLTARLRRLERDGVVKRTVVPTSPPTVEYALTDLGNEFAPVLQAIVDVGHRLKQHQGAVGHKVRVRVTKRA
jgi:DNA-binding HxlR family transcriptional regulator